MIAMTIMSKFLAVIERERDESNSLLHFIESISCKYIWPKMTKILKTFRFYENNYIEKIEIEAWLIWDKVFKNGLSEIYGGKPLKNLKWKAVFHKYYLVHFWGHFFICISDFKSVGFLIMIINHCLHATKEIPNTPWKVYINYHVNYLIIKSQSLRSLDILGLPPTFRLF